MSHRHPDHDDWESPWRDTSRRFVRDMRLREAGFQIHSRPKEGPVLWRRHGVVVTQEEAEALLLTGRVG